MIFHDYWKDADIFDCDMVSAEMIFDEGYKTGRAELEAERDRLRAAIQNTLDTGMDRYIREALEGE